MNFVLNNRQYQVLKWLVSIVLPAFITFLGVVMGTLNYAHTDVVLTIAAAFEVLLGTIFKISEHNYDRGAK